MKTKKEKPTGGLQLPADISNALTAHAGRHSTTPQAMIEEAVLRQLDGIEQMTIQVSQGELLRLKRAAEFIGGGTDRYVRQAIFSMVELDEDEMQSR